MAAEQVTAKGKQPNGEFIEMTVNYDFGANTSEAAKMFGEEVLFNHAKSSMVVWLQAAIRRYIAKGLAQPAIQAAVSALKPGVVVRSTKDRNAEYAKYLAALSPEERNAKINELKALLAGKK